MNVELQKEINLAGFRDGVEWRDKLATKGQLVRLRRFAAERPDFENWFDEIEDCGSDTPAASLVCVFDPSLADQRGYGLDPIEDFWSEVGGENADTDDVDYLQGFIEGALSK